MFLAELSRKFGNHVTVHRPTARRSVRTTGIPIFTLTFSSYFGSPLIAHQCCDQLTAVKTRYPLTSITWPYRGLRCRPIQVEYFFVVIRWRVTSFQMIAGSFFKFIWNMLCLCHYGPALLTFWFQTDLGRENSARFLKMQAGKTDAFHFSHHSHALVTLHVQFLCYNWSKFDVSSYGKFMPHLATCSLWQP